MQARQISRSVSIASCRCPNEWSLLSCRADDNGRDVLEIDHAVEVLGASELRKEREFISHLLQLAADFLARFQAQLDGLADHEMEYVKQGP